MKPFSLTGSVIHGNHLGRSLGYPTANLDLTSDKVPQEKSGVYAVLVHYKGSLYGGMANIGTRPTIKENGFTVEVHLFGFTGNLYGQKLTVDFMERIRDELKFGSLPKLMERMNMDELLAKKMLSDLL